MPSAHAEYIAVHESLRNVMCDRFRGGSMKFLIRKGIDDMTEDLFITISIS